MLSEREREVAALVVQGLTYKEIGERLFISAKTVEHHVARMRQRLGVTGRGELFAQLRADPRGLSVGRPGRVIIATGRNGTDPSPPCRLR